MEIQVFRNENSSQTNANLHYSNYSYSRLIPNEHALRHINSSYYPSLKAVSYGPSTKYGGHKGSCVLMTPTIECRSTPRSTRNRHVGRRSVNMSTDTWSTLDQQQVIVGRVSTESCVGRQSAASGSIGCRHSANTRPIPGRYLAALRSTLLRYTVSMHLTG